MECKEKGCKCERACDLLGKCLFVHHLVIGHEGVVSSLLKDAHNEKSQTKAVLNFFQSRQPFKITPKDQSRDYFNRMVDQYGLTKKQFKIKKKGKVRPIQKIVRGHIPTACDYKEGRIETMAQFLQRLNCQSTKNFHEE